jgi:BRCA1-associated protein
MSRLEGLQCPVCRFQHDSFFTSTSCELCDIDNQHLRSMSGETNYFADCDDEDMWVCVVCGFVGCGASRMNHIELHYEDHLHAYAMNTTSKRVWDFAGEGYVHRLILSKSDDVSTSELNTDGSLVKMLELADPR